MVASPPARRTARTLVRMAAAPRASCSLPPPASPAGAALVWAVAFETARGVRLDARALADFMDAGRNRPCIRSPRSSRASPTRCRSRCSAPACWRSRSAAAACAWPASSARCCSAPAVTSQVLKQLTADPRGSTSSRSRTSRPPRGRAATRPRRPRSRSASSRVAPARLRPLAIAAGGAFALAVGVSVLVLGWHFPSDVLGGVCVAAAWTLCGLAAAGYPRPT